VQVSTSASASINYFASRHPPTPSTQTAISVSSRCRHGGESHLPTPIATLLLAGDARCPRPVRPFPFPLPLLLAARIPEQGDPRKNPRSRLVAVSQLRLTCLTSKDMLVKALNCQARNSSCSRFATVLLGGVVVCVWRLLDMLYLLSHCAYMQLGYDDSAASQ
jgi:hypothetical protein